MKDVLKPPGSLLVTDRSKAVFGVILTKCFWSRCFMSYFVFFCSLYICKRLWLIYLLLCVFCLEGFPLPLGAWDGQRHFIVALPGPSI